MIELALLEHNFDVCLAAATAAGPDMVAAPADANICGFYRRMENFML